MKITTTVHQLLFFKATDIYTLDTKIWKNILNSYEKKHLNMQRTSISSTEDKNCYFNFTKCFLNVFNIWQYHFPLKSLLWKILLFGLLCHFRLFQLASSVSLLCCQMCIFYCPLRKKRCTLLSEGTDVHIW